MKEYNYNRIIKPDDLNSKSFFYVSNLVEKRKYFHFYTGPIGKPNYPCIKEAGIVDKKMFTSERTEDKCKDGTYIFKLTRK